MSNWDAYCNNLKTAGLAHALIINIDDGSVWGKDTDCPAPKPADLQMIAKRAKKTASEADRRDKIMLMDNKYFYTREDEETGLIQGKMGTAGVLIAACTKCVIVATYDDKIVPGEANKQVQAIQDFLKESNL